VLSGSLKSATAVSISLLFVACLISDFTLESFSRFLPGKITVQLFFANSRAVALPIAPVAPVIKTDFSSHLFLLFHKFTVSL
jgi:hypothetical protein